MQQDNSQHNEGIRLDIVQGVIVTKNTGKDGVTRTFARTIAPEGLNLITEDGQRKWLTVFFPQSSIEELREAFKEAEKVTTQSGQSYYRLGYWKMTGSLKGESFFVNEASKASSVLNLNTLSDLLS